jgi:hypothetical protein
MLGEDAVGATVWTGGAGSSAAAADVALLVRWLTSTFKSADSPTPRGRSIDGSGKIKEGHHAHDVLASSCKWASPDSVKAEVGDADNRDESWDGATARTDSARAQASRRTREKVTRRGMWASGGRNRVNRGEQLNLRATSWVIRFACGASQHANTQ